MFPIDLINNELDSVSKIIPDVYIPIKRSVSFFNSPLEDYFSFCIEYTQHFFIFLKRHSAFIFIFLLFIFLVLSLIFHCNFRALQNKKTLHELFIFFYSLVCFVILFYIVMYIFKAHSFTKFAILSVASFGIGLFYSKKNTDFLSEFLQVISIIIGISCISIAVVLLFKTMQFCI